jgi:spore cortex formation protein SpoVR/YcgB (stage V sporulation)
MNPYALGFAMFRDLRRICEHPTEEDRRWLPDVAGSDWKTTVDFAMRNFKDESFIAQFLSPKLIRDFRLFCLIDDDSELSLKVGAIHNDEGYRAVRENLARQYSLAEREPNIQVNNVDFSGDRSLTLRYFRRDQRPLATEFKDAMKHLASLWGFNVRLETVTEQGSVEPTHECIVEKRRRAGGMAAASAAMLRGY